MEPVGSLGLEDLRREVEVGLLQLKPDDRSTALNDAVAYVLEGTGKRVRPLMVLTTADAFCGSPLSALPAALAVEVFHNFTLVHDDIMDRSDSRRGRPTVHVKWDESIGILAGDYLLGLSFDLLARLDPSILPTAIRRFHKMVTQLCEGQALDTEFETRLVVSIDEYLRMISLKTGALLEASLALGGLVGGASTGDITALESVGRHAGCAFQIQDDLLDLTADSADWGKPVGGDLVVGKKSYLSILGLEREKADGASWLTDRLAAGGVSPDEIDEARSRLSEMGILQHAEREIAQHYEAALTTLEEMKGRADITGLLQIIEKLLNRTV